MSRSEPDDRLIGGLFARRRSEDAANLPAFDRLIERPAPPRPSPARLVTVGLATAAASLSIVAIAFWQLDESAPVRSAGVDIRIERTPEPAASVPEPQPAPEVKVPDSSARPTPEPRTERAAGGKGGLVVRVVDSAGAPLPAATVTLSHEAGLVAAESFLSNKHGEVVVRDVQAGSGYVVETSFPGVATRRDVDVRVSTGETTTQAITLATDRIERVAVAAREMVADLERSSEASRFSDDFIQDLPVAGNAYQNTLSLAPGVNDSDGDGNRVVHGSRSRDFKTAVAGPADPSRVSPNSMEELELVIAEAKARQNAPAASQKVEVSREQIAQLRAVGYVAASPPPVEAEPILTESYHPIVENDFLNAGDKPLSTFSIDVDTASYSNVRRFLQRGQLPPADAVRIEELINYFDYDDPEPRGRAPFSVNLELGECPWRPEHLLARIGLQAERVSRSQTAGSNLVFLIDVSGSMNDPQKLPLLQQSIGMLADALTASDRVAIVVYAGSAGLVLDSVSGADKAAIRQAVNRLRAGGSTAGGQGIRLAYQVARDNFIEGGVNRVILATDGDFNVGATGHAELMEIIQADADRGVFLTALGFGGGNLQDGRLEQLADRGNGNYAYIDSIHEAKKVLVDELEGTLYTVAKDVKIQVEFNPARVAGYRLIGYENRKLADADFNDDTKDAGEIGSGHSVTALYEIVPAGLPLPRPGVDALKYQRTPELTEAARSGEWMTVKLRYKKPDGRKSRLIEESVSGEPLARGATSADFDFAAAVAAFGMLLRDSEHAGDATLSLVRDVGARGSARDAFGYRAEFLELVERAAPLLDSAGDR